MTGSASTSCSTCGAPVPPGRGRCATCGTRVFAPTAVAGSPVARTAGQRPGVEDGPGGRERKWRRWAYVLWAIAGINLVDEIADIPNPFEHFEFGEVVVSLGMAAGGVALRRSADQEGERRRRASYDRLQAPVLKLAAERGGRLTVTETAAALGWTLPQAQSVLQMLETQDLDFRISSEVTDEGVLVYEFRELLRQSPSRSALPG